LEVKGLALGDFFETAKPEKLIHRILHLATGPNDWVLDAFLGCGTTAAVAHKMGRRWVGIEAGAHCNTLCLKRLRAVVDGRDRGGISEEVGWRGGGGFKFFENLPR
jgi:adenine-specific DNA-methyltransferase